MGFLIITIIVILVFVFGSAQQAGYQENHKRACYEGAVKYNELTYYDIKAKCNRCTLTNLPVYERYDTDKYNNQFTYSVFKIPTVNGLSTELFVRALYCKTDKRNTPVPITEEWLQQKHLMRVTDYKLRYNPLCLKFFDLRPLA